MTLVAAGVLAWYGANRPEIWSVSWASFVVYWGMFFLLLAASLYIVVLDIHFIRLQYVLAKRELYRQTLGEENFRRALIQAQQKDVSGPDSSDL